MTKEEKIKESWIEALGVEVYEYNRKFIDENGCMNYDKRCGELESRFEMVNDIDLDWCNVRPKSLSGIENNNGWISIDNKLDLPIERSYYFVIMNGKKTIMGYNPEYQKWIGEGYYYFEPHGNLKITHYQKIDFPQDNIY